MLSAENREKLKKESAANRSQGVAMANEICRRYRREGRFFDVEVAIDDLKEIHWQNISKS